MTRLNIVTTHNQISTCILLIFIASNFTNRFSYDVPGSAMQHELFRRVVVSAAAWLDDKEFVQ